METDKLKARVLSFIKNEPGYDKIRGEELKVTYSMTDDFFILLGENIQIGVAGFGETPDLAFDDFVRSWKEFGGAEWIKNNRVRLFEKIFENSIIRFIFIA